jgi:VIT1/CCC1 family predicted Fe2+/Mn2+ transporter
MPAKNEGRFVEKYLDPASRLGEILFGLIMVLTVTSTAGIAVVEEKNGVRDLLFAAIGCNIAWGIIDAIMYVMNCMTARSHRARLIQEIRKAADQRAALALVRDEVDAGFEDVIGSQEREAISQTVLEHLAKSQTKRTRITRDDLWGALACFWLVVVSCFPATIPFLIFSDARFALRVSNALLIVMLFVVGQKWAQYVYTSRWIAGLTMVGIGLGLVGVAVLLGG